MIENDNDYDSKDGKKEDIVLLWVGGGLDYKTFLLTLWSLLGSAGVGLMFLRRSSSFEHLQQI